MLDLKHAGLLIFSFLSTLLSKSTEITSLGNDDRDSFIFQQNNLEGKNVSTELTCVF